MLKLANLNTKKQTLIDLYEILIVKNLKEVHQIL